MNTDEKDFDINSEPEGEKISKLEIVAIVAFCIAVVLLVKFSV